VYGLFEILRLSKVLSKALLLAIVNELKMWVAAYFSARAFGTTFPQCICEFLVCWSKVLLVRMRFSYDVVWRCHSPKFNFFQFLWGFGFIGNKPSAFEESSSFWCNSDPLARKARFPYDRPNRPHRPSRLKKNVQTIGTIIWKRYPDNRKRPGRFKIHTIIPIVRIELNSIQAIEVVSVVRVVFAIVWEAFPYDRPDRLNIFLRRLGRSGRFGWSYGNQA